MIDGGWSYVPSILAWRKPLHSRDNSGIDEILLCLLLRVGEELDEGQQSVHSSQGFNQALFIVVVDALPGQGWFDGGFWGWLVGVRGVVQVLGRRADLSA